MIGTRLDAAHECLRLQTSRHLLRTVPFIRFTFDDELGFGLHMFVVLAKGPGLPRIPVTIRQNGAAKKGAAKR